MFEYAHSNPVNSDMLAYAKERGFGDLHMKIDPETGLVAIIAIHSTKRGPALGGCRWIEYSTTNDAIYDAMRLARGMSFKAAISDLPLGGGKAVLVKPQQIDDHHAYFKSFAEFVASLDGRYITAVDSGTSLADMDVVEQYTPYVASSTSIQGEPSPSTGLGVLQGLKAAVKAKLGRDSVEGLHIAIQGLGKVGYDLSRRLHAEGAKLTVADVDQAAVKRCIAEFDADVAAVEEIHQIECDVFSPNALGAILHEESIARLKTTVIAGGANNQLEKPELHGQLLHDKGILLAPDFVINAGGLIFALSRYQQPATFDPNEKIMKIYDTCLSIFERSASQNLPTNIVAEHIAQERIDNFGG